MDNPQKRSEMDQESAASAEQNDAATTPLSDESSESVTPTQAPEASEQSTADATSQTTAQGTAGTTNSKLVYAVIIAVIAAILIGAYLYTTKTKTASNLEAGTQAASTSDIGELLDLEKTNPVASVNGETLSWSDYKRSLNEVLQNANAQGLDVSSTRTQEQIKEQALTSLVNTELLLQAAHEEGLSANESEVQSEYDNIKSQLGGKKELDKMLTKFDLTREDLRTSIAEQLVINAYIDQEVDPSSIEVTNQEVQALYDQAAANAQEGQLPPLEQVRGAIESQIQSTKQQDLVASLIETLREAANIEKQI